MESLSTVPLGSGKHGAPVLQSEDDVLCYIFIIGYLKEGKN